MISDPIGYIVNPAISILRAIFFTLDTMIYSLCGGIYRAALSVYDINKLMDTSEVITRFADVVYSFLAIYMFFKVAFSLLQMLVDPSLIEDKQKGAGKIVQNIMICLALIVAVPMIFNGARKVQTTIIEDQIIEKAIYGKSFSQDDTYSNVGHKLAIASWTIFMHPNDTLNEDASAKQIWKNATNLDNASNAWEAFGELFGKINSASVTGRYHIKYLWGISTIFGIYLVWVFIKLAIDIAYRSLKLLVLQIVSPIAIVSYIDPKSSKDGIFSKWTKECVKTYVSLFIRIIIYAVASVILIEFTKNINSNAANFDFDGIVKVVYVLAILALIKSGPKMFDNIFGTELSKESETKFATDMLRGVMGAGAGLAVGGIAGAAVAKKMDLSNAARARMAWEGMKKGVSSGYGAGKKGDIMGFGKSMMGAINADAGRSYYGLPNVADSKKASEKMNLAKKVALKVASRKEQFTGLKEEPTTEAGFRENVINDYQHGTLEQQKKAEKMIEQMGYGMRDANGNVIRDASGKIAIASVIRNADGSVNETATREADKKRAIVSVDSQRQKFRKIYGDGMSAHELYEGEFADMIAEKSNHDSIAYAQNILAETYGAVKGNISREYTSAQTLKNTSGLKTILQSQLSAAYLSEMSAADRAGVVGEISNAINVCNNTGLTEENKLIQLQTIISNLTAQYGNASDNARGKEQYSSGKAKDASERIKGLSKDAKHIHDATTFELANEGDPYLDKKDIIAEAKEIRRRKP